MYWWCKREWFESNALNTLELNNFKIINGILIYCKNLDLLPPKHKFTFINLKKEKRALSFFRTAYKISFVVMSEIFGHVRKVVMLSIIFWTIYL